MQLSGEWYWEQDADFRFIEMVSNTIHANSPDLSLVLGKRGFNQL
jgi:hypothetical protein